MKRVTLDKVASVTANCRIDREVRVGTEFPCKEGDVIAVRILTRKSTYNTLELTTGRFSQLKPGDVVVGALGHRRALVGYAGHLPKSLAVGDVIHMLNIGGCLGICTSTNPDMGMPFECEVLGQVLHFPYLGERIGVPANITQNALPVGEDLNVKDVPVVAVVGTCMDSGKTYACVSLIQEFTRRGLKVHAAKATGVSLRRDLLSMQDAGALKTVTFTDMGVVTTQKNNAPLLARTMLTHLAEGAPDVIVLELGDGLMGSYGVDTILKDPLISKKLNAVVLAANDPVGAWGGVRQLLDDFELRPTVITGPSTDNDAGTDLLRERLGIEAWNARVSPSELANAVLHKVGLEGSCA